MNRTKKCAQCDISLRINLVWDDFFDEAFCSSECHEDYCADNFERMYLKHYEFYVTEYDG